MNANAMPWIYLLFAILLEVSGTSCMKLSDGFRHLVPSVFVFVFYSSSLVFLTLSIRAIDLSVAYAVWSALGTALIAVIGAHYFGETMDATRIAFIGLIIVGVVGLNLTSK